MRELWRVDELVKLATFLDWRGTLDKEYKGMVDSRIVHVGKGHIGDFKNLKKSLYELRWASTLRVYFSRMKYRIVLIYGSTSKKKKKQSKAIGKARGFLNSYKEGQLT